MKKLKKVIFDGKEMEVLSYDEDFQTVEVPVVLCGLNGEYCPLNSKHEPITSVLEGDLMVCEDVVDAAGLVVWSAICLFTLFAIHVGQKIFNHLN